MNNKNNMYFYLIKYYKSNNIINKDLKLYKIHNNKYVFNINDNTKYRKLKYKNCYYKYIANNINNYFKNQ